MPFCRTPVCLPVLLRLWRGKGTASPVRAGRDTDHRCCHKPSRPTHPHRRRRRLPRQGAAGAGLPRSPPGCPANAALYAAAPPRTGKRGRPDPRRRGGSARPAELAATAQWRRATITRYGRSDTVEIADIDTIWYGAFGNTPGRTVLVREPGDDRTMLAVFTTDTDSDTETVVTRYAHRWP